TLDPNGRMCDCGRLGCLQTFISSSEIEKQTKMPIQKVFKEFKEGKDWAVNLIKRSKDYLGLTISNMVCLYNPEAVLLAGPMVDNYPELIENIEKIANQYVWEPYKDSFKIIQPSLGKDSGIIGASSLVLSEFLRHTNIDI